MIDITIKIHFYEACVHFKKMYASIITSSRIKDVTRSILFNQPNRITMDQRNIKRHPNIISHENTNIRLFVLDPNNKLEYSF